ncbi:fumarylacetoacetate hydrolase family protein [Acinetobacter gerneri]|uniref:4-hydroxyphenylacetate degradation bifunctional isomerase/decarboxylase, N-terminal subunit n=2 Tax=Acinetobacter gerneri TaxID=202952 RepID=N8ZN71_9GAMM|nr:fumarylacetoacetate hydrolase family protein [Acinetobacter gerneri]ENV33213.1 4-hydroxyphenylacetate degradation bifunctional isomerase/decarboxylase, N-terminal subunit [Acinetobacter gerneri DSM 14967 = CIP 107464 = MTCC 9824]EPR82324.1 2-hydroxyhepta-2,4-diene-1,7-dioate isomerase [Acinetobacter gerneri DSM 14967 = CIP 107464 = MTCC 9824]MDQ9010504.1 fumarylacetoacetate hydrolase family protein [Acinetobacter gerneri]MDQ9014703.1 fumarylacetoacetate hydrolase family protein [Acinetobacte
MSTSNSIDTQGNIFGIALNYKSLYETLKQQFNEKPYVKEPVKPVLFIKTPNTRNQSGQAVIKRAGEILQAGPAVGIVIGKSTSRVKKSDANAHIAGYVVINELSLPEESYYRPAIKAKCQDGFCVLGNAVAKDQVTDVDHLELRVYVNGELKQTGNTSDWIRSPEQIIEEISDYMPLSEGDIIITGTPLGRVNLQHGDVVRVEVDQLGAIENTITEEGV